MDVIDCERHHVLQCVYGDEGGKRPSTYLRIPVPPEVRNIFGDMKRDKQQLSTSSIITRAQQCPNLETAKCCYCAETGHSAQNCPSKSVKRCVNCNGQNSVFYNGCLEFKKHWACAQKRQSIVSTGASVVRKPAVSASPFVVPPPRAASFSKDTTLKSTGSNDSHCLSPSQLVTMEILEKRLEESCNKLLTVMQARFTEAIVFFEKKLSTLIGNLVNLPDLISSSLPRQRSAKLKRANATETNSQAAKKFNVGSSVIHSDNEDVFMEVEETDTEYVTRIINTHASLINNGTAALISDDTARNF
ncbi:hypothetical protein ACOME3_002423 [Neoechinorhynchus agilis]